jgi:hypothetical protein
MHDWLKIDVNLRHGTIVGSVCLQSLSVRNYNSPDTRVQILLNRTLTGKILTVFISLVFGDQFVTLKLLCNSECTVGISIKWRSFNVTASCLHFRGARCPEGDRFDLTHVAVRSPANQSAVLLIQLQLSTCLIP